MDSAFMPTPRWLLQFCFLFSACIGFLTFSSSRLQPVGKDVLAADHPLGAWDTNL
jgi:hypothetical protein